jgi:hypothetical protein
MPSSKRRRSSHEISTSISQCAEAARPKKKRRQKRKSGRVAGAKTIEESGVVSVEEAADVSYNDATEGVNTGENRNADTYFNTSGTYIGSSANAC